MISRNEARDVHRAEFHEFFARNHRDLARFAYLVIGDGHAADDLAADALAAAWEQWDRVRKTRSPLAYVRGMIAKLAKTHIRSMIRERRRLRLVGVTEEEIHMMADVPMTVLVRAALQGLPLRKRACVVLRHIFDLSEEETARTLGVSVGTVKSQTSRGVAELQRILQPQRENSAPAGPGWGRR